MRTSGRTATVQAAGISPGMNRRAFSVIARSPADSPSTRIVPGGNAVGSSGRSLGATWWTIRISAFSVAIAHWQSRAAGENR